MLVRYVFVLIYNVMLWWDVLFVLCVDNLGKLFELILKFWDVNGLIV